MSIHEATVDARTTRAHDGARRDFERTAASLAGCASLAFGPQRRDRSLISAVRIDLGSVRSASAHEQRQPCQRQGPSLDSASEKNGDRARCEQAWDGVAGKGGAADQGQRDQGKGVHGRPNSQLLDRWELLGNAKNR